MYYGVVQLRTVTLGVPTEYQELSTTPAPCNSKYSVLCLFQPSTNLSVPQMDINQALQKQLSDRQRMKAANVERIWTRKQIENAFIETFELIGGVPRLAIWANEPENYGEFLKLLMKLAPKDTSAAVQASVIEYRSNLGASNLPPPRAPLCGEDVSDGELVGRDD